MHSACGYSTPIGQVKELDTAASFDSCNNFKKRQKSKTRIEHGSVIRSSSIRTTKGDFSSWQAKAQRLSQSFALECMHVLYICWRGTQSVESK